MMASSGGSGTVVPILIAVAVFAAGFSAYMYHSIPNREELLAESSGPDPQTSAAFAGAEALDAKVKAVSAEFTERVRDERYSDAYALMASAYRAGSKESDFVAACKRSPFLTSARSVTLYKVKESVAPGGSAGAISGEGVLTSGAGAVAAKLNFITEGDRLTVLSVSIADVPVLAPR